MDPFIEGQCWKDFHSRFIASIGDALMPELRPRYIARVEERVYVDVGETRKEYFPDVGVAKLNVKTETELEFADRGGVAVATPVRMTVRSGTIRFPYLKILDSRRHELVAVIEMLSPTNKRSRSIQRLEYLKKRATLLASAAHLVELDLLRGGSRLPFEQKLPRGDYFASVSRFDERPDVLVYPWRMAESMPTIPIPLLDGDADITLNLQSVFDGVYDRVGYDYSLNYDLPLAPPADEETQAWVDGILANRQVNSR